MVGDRGRRRLEAAEVLLKVGHIVGILGWLEILCYGVEVDAVLGQEVLILAEAVYQVPLMGLLLPAAGRLRRDDTTLDVGLDAVRAGLLFVAPNLTLLTQDTRVAPRQLHHRWFRTRDGRQGHGEGYPLRRRRWFGALGLLGSHGRQYVRSVLRAMPDARAQGTHPTGPKKESLQRANRTGATRDV